MYVFQVLVGPNVVGLYSLCHAVDSIISTVHMTTALFMARRLERPLYSFTLFTVHQSGVVCFRSCAQLASSRGCKIAT